MARPASRPNPGLIALLSGLALLLALAGCGSDGGTGAAPPPEPPQTTSAPEPTQELTFITTPPVPPPVAPPPAAAAPPAPAVPPVAKPRPKRTTKPKPTRKPASKRRCDPSYPGICIPPPPPDLDCPDVGYRDFRVVGSDRHRFDADHDGIGCES